MCLNKIIKGEEMSVLKNNNFEISTDDYAYGKKSVSKLQTSNYNLSLEQKTIIKMSLDYDIMDIRTYAGYKGDLIVQIIAEHKEVLQQMKSISKKLGIESVLKTNSLMMVYELFCICETVNPAYTLK